MSFRLNKGVPEFSSTGIIGSPAILRFDFEALMADLKKIEPLAGVFAGLAPKVEFCTLGSTIFGRANIQKCKIQLSPTAIRGPANLLHTTVHELCHLEKSARVKVGSRIPWHGPAFYKLLAASLDALYQLRTGGPTTMYSATYAVRKWKMYEFDNYSIVHPRTLRLANEYVSVTRLRTDSPATPVDDILEWARTSGVFKESS